MKPEEIAVTPQDPKLKSLIRPNGPIQGIEWAWMEIKAAEIAREKAGKHGFAVYCAICILAWRARSDHKSNVMAGIPEIMKITGLGRMSVSETIQKLRKTELLGVASGDMKGNANAYTLYIVGPSGGLPWSATRTTRVRRADYLGPPHGHQAKGRKDTPALQEISLSSENSEDKGENAGAISAQAESADVSPVKKKYVNAIGTF